MGILYNKEEEKEPLTNPVEIYNELGKKYFGGYFIPYPLDSELYRYTDKKALRISRER